MFVRPCVPYDVTSDAVSANPRTYKGNSKFFDSEKAFYYLESPSEQLHIGQNPVDYSEISSSIADNSIYMFLPTNAFMRCFLDNLNIQAVRYRQRYVYEHRAAGYFAEILQEKAR